MTVSTTARRVQHATNGTTGPFTVTFPFLSTSHLAVTHTDSGGVETLLTLNVDYTVAGADVTTTVAYPAVGFLTIVRSIPALQELDLRDGDSFPAESFERSLDLLTMLVQGVLGDLDRTLRVPELTTTYPNLPDAATRALRILGFDAVGDPTAVVPTPGDASALALDLLDTSNNAKNDAMVAVKRTATNAVATTIHNWMERQVFNVRADFNAAGDGAADDTAAVNAAIAAASALGGAVVYFPPGDYRVTSQIVVPARVRLLGCGFSDVNGTGGANRGATCILRAFVGASATVLASGDDCSIDLIDFDNNTQGTGECVQVTGSRVDVGSCSYRNSGGDGLRIGKTDSGVSTVNANCWSARKVIVCGNAAAGMRVDDTNTSVSLSYPLGAANANAGYCALVDARNNGTDGLQLGNCNDNVFSMVVSQSNTGCGIRFKTDGTNSGPRCNHILGNDCESNTGNDIQIDAATLPAAGPGLYNMVFGNRSVAVSSRIVDNSTGSLVMQWSTNVPQRGYHFGPHANVLNLAGNAGYWMAAGPNAAPAGIYAAPSGAADTVLRAQVHKNGGALADCWEINQFGIPQPLNDLATVTYSASMTIDARTGHIQIISANNGTAFTINAPTNPYLGGRMTITIRNTSGGALGVATWNAIFKMAAWTQPANGNSRSIDFYYNGANWIEADRTPADIPN